MGKKLSIITINYNNAEGLRKTMKSVFKQVNRDFEYVVIDGASTDGSANVIESYVDRTAGLIFKWVSEPDTGIYNAMNKGLKMAEGEYTLMLNSGDFLIDEHVIDMIMPELHTEDIIQGNVIEDFPDKTIRNCGYGRSNINFVDAMGTFFPHQSTFIKLSTMKQFGYYDENYRKSSDSYFFVTALALGNASFRYVNIDITNYDVNGISSLQDPKWRLIDKEEDAKWFGEHISNRLWEFYQIAPKKMHLYDQLHKYKFIWYMVMALARISEWLSPTPAKVKIEQIKK